MEVSAIQGSICPTLIYLDLFECPSRPSEGGGGGGGGGYLFN